MSKDLTIELREALSKVIDPELHRSITELGMVDTLGRVLLPPALGSMAIFMLMALILAWRPRGLFTVHG